MSPHSLFVLVLMPKQKLNWQINSYNSLYEDYHFCLVSHRMVCSLFQAFLFLLTLVHCTLCDFFQNLTPVA